MEHPIRSRARIVVYLRGMARDLESPPVAGLAADPEQAAELRELAQRFEDCAESSADHERVRQILDAMLAIAKALAPA